MESSGLVWLELHMLVHKFSNWQSDILGFNPAYFLQLHCPPKKNSAEVTDEEVEAKGIEDDDMNRKGCGESRVWKELHSVCSEAHLVSWAWYQQCRSPRLQSICC